MTSYLRAATAFRSVAVLAVLAAVWVVFAGHPWWTVPAVWVAFLTAFLGGRCHLAHHRTIADLSIALTSRTRP
ncbi:hypothetical protein [Streptomyces sp. NPDC001658]